MRISSNMNSSNETWSLYDRSLSSKCAAANDALDNMRKECNK
jgi:hypothetical protein